MVFEPHKKREAIQAVAEHLAGSGALGDGEYRRGEDREQQCCVEVGESQDQGVPSCLNVGILLHHCFFPIAM